MTTTPNTAQLISDLRRLTLAIPLGRLITFGTLSAHLKTSPRHIATLMETLAGTSPDGFPWHRIVADGGAVGRHARREEQIRRLQAEGVAVSQGGFVQDFTRVVIHDIAAPMPAAAKVVSAPLSRSRGIKDRPQ